MDKLFFVFPVSGVGTWIFLPPLIAFCISFFTSMAGVSGAFLLLPFQVSVLHYTAPSVSGTNHVYNVVGIPGGLYRYIKEGRMLWPLALVIIAGTLPGVFAGYLLRVRYLPDPRAFKLFVGCVLLYIGVRLLYEVIRSGKDRKAVLFNPGAARPRPGGVVKTVRLGLDRVEFEYAGKRFSFSTPGMFGLALVVGVIGGAYGIGGGAIIAPFCVSVFHLPVYTVAGAALMGTFVASAAGALFFTFGGVACARPDWLLGVMFGLGGIAGMYLGARTQKYVPQNIIKTMLAALMILLSIRYITGYMI